MVDEGGVAVMEVGGWGGVESMTEDVRHDG